jgi:uncharacterized membrane protein YfcA
MATLLAGQEVMVGFVAALFVSALIQSITGFGFGLIGVVLLGFIMNVREASASIAAVGLALNAMLLARYWRDFRWQRVWPVLIAAAVASPLGLMFLQRAPSRGLYLVLGLVLLMTFAHLQFVPRAARRPWHPFFLGVPSGVVGGWIGGAFGAGGPPIVAYLATQQFPLSRYIASLQAVFAVTSGARVVSLAWSGFFTGPVIGQVTAGCVAAASGAGAGLLLARRMRKSHLDKATLWFIGLAGVYYLARSWMRG